MIRIAIPTLRITHKSELANALGHFYPSLRNKKGDTHAIQSLLNARSGINRHLIMPPYNRIWNLMSDVEFSYANRIFKGFRRKLKEGGHDKKKKKPVLSPADLNKIYTEYFEPDFDIDPICLQHKVYLDIAYFLGWRGSEGL